MDKDVMKRRFATRLPVVPWELILRSDWESHPVAVASELKRACAIRYL